MGKNRNTLKKLNHAWVISDGITGHEVQSLALAHHIAKNVNVYQCQLSRPWLTFAPKILPFFEKGLKWNQSQPNRKQKPDVIISCGRRMAAVAKYLKTKTNSRHIQILNPRDNHDNYDLIICPKHDNIKGNNIITCLGSLHQFNISFLKKIASSCQTHTHLKQPLLSLFLGNPHVEFFKQFDQLSQQIRKHYPNHVIAICGSRRTNEKYQQMIRNIFSDAEICWFSHQDGENPYQCLLATSQILIVTADSINMVSEACATDKPVIVVATEQISVKHQKFIHSVQHRLSKFGHQKITNEPLKSLKELAQDVLKRIT